MRTTFLPQALFLFLIMSAGLWSGCGSQPEGEQLHDLVRFIDPQIGSVHGRWFFYTPAARPFGMAKLAPHTNAYGSAGGWGPTGYDDRHTSIEGFGHFHEFQVGGLVYMPTTGKLQTIPGTLEDPDGGYRSRFEKDEEQAEAGFYRVKLQDYEVEVALTATDRVGLQRYRCTSADTMHVIMDLGHRQGESGVAISAEASWNGDKEVSGMIVTYPEYARFCDPEQYVRMYFVAEFDRVPFTSGSFVDSLITPGAKSTSGTLNGLYLNFSGVQDTFLEVRTGLSYTSIENARANMAAEARGLTFEQIKDDARRAWNEKLNRIVVEGGREEDRTKFYTGLYHALLGRGLASDINGQYPRADGTAGQIPLDKNGEPIHHHYNTDGMWGGFWNLSQLWALAYPEYFSNYLQSNLDIYEDRGWLHDGEACGIYTNGVQTNFQGLLIASAYHCGIRDFDINTAYAAARKNELEASGRNLGNGKYDLHHFQQLGYVPYKDTTISNGWVFNFGASHTLEYAFSSYAVAELAASLGHTEDAARLMDQAGYYRNLFDGHSGFIRPRLPEGPFIEDFDPTRAWDGFQEGNAFQFTWFVPHDVAGLIDLMGIDTFETRLQSMFEDASKTNFGGASDEIHSFSGVEKLYNHGNQPCLHDAWLFNYTRKPWLTQQWVHTICRDFYGTEPLRGYGVGQDEDQGQLGAWYVMASMGLFDVQGHAAARPTFQFAAPAFERIAIELDQQYFPGERLIIKTQGLGQSTPYIQSIKWNGKPLGQNWIYRDLLMEGGTLDFTLSDVPDTTWGIGQHPPSMQPQE